MIRLISDIKTIVINFVLLGIIASYLTINLAIELDYFNKILISTEVFFINISILFIIMELVIYMWGLLNNKSKNLFGYSYLSIFIIFIVEVFLLYTTIIKSDNMLLGLDYRNILMILEIIKVLIVLISSTTRTIEILENKKTINNYNFKHLEN